MKPSDMTAFSARWIAAQETYGRTVGDAALALAFNALKRYPLEQVVDALSRHMENPDTGQFFPKPADIVRLISGDSTGRAAHAWTMLIGTLERVGTNQTVVFDDPLIHLCVMREGGWLELGKVTEEELPFLRHRFEQLYRSLAGQPVPWEHVEPKLVGRDELENRAHGFEEFVPEPVLIGDPAQCRRVQNQGQGRALLIHRPEKGVVPLLSQK